MQLQVTVPAQITFQVAAPDVGTMVRVTVPPHLCQQAGQPVGMQMDIPITPGTLPGSVIDVIIPHNGQITVAAPDGRQVLAQVPAGLAPGSLFLVEIPDVVQPVVTQQHVPPAMQQPAVPLSGLDKLCASNPLFSPSSSGVRAAVPSDLAAGWFIYTEHSITDYLFFTSQSSALLAIVCTHRNHPTSAFRRLLLELVS